MISWPPGARPPHDLLLGGELLGLLAGLLEDALGLPLGLGQHLLALLDDPARLLDLLGDGRAHLVEEVVDLLAVDPHLSVSGTVRALWTRSSSLSMSTRTSILSDPPWLAYPRVGNSSPQAAGHRRRHEVVDLAAERRDLLDAARAQEAVLGRSHHEHCFDVGGQLPVELRHRELVLEVGDGPQALEDDVRVPAPRELDDELMEAVDDRRWGAPAARRAGRPRARRRRRASACAWGDR